MQANSSFDRRSGQTQHIAGHEPFYTVDNIDLDRIVNNITIPDQSHLILGFGPCRVGTKAQLFTMAVSGYTAYEQPLKAAYRCLGHDWEPESFNPTEPVFYTKETIGPYTPGESLFNPVSILGEATDDRWMREQLDLILLLRDPVDTWYSWKSVWSDRLELDDLFSHFKQSFETTRDIVQRAREDGLSLHLFDYRLNKQPVETYDALFDTLGLDKSPVVSGWRDEEYRKRLDRNFIKFKEPDVFLPEGIRKQAKASDGIHHQTYDTPSLDRKDEIENTAGTIYRDLIRSVPGPNK